MPAEITMAGTNMDLSVGSWVVRTPVGETYVFSTVDAVKKSYTLNASTAESSANM